MPPREDRLDQPVRPGRRLRGPSVDPDAFGRWTERVARLLGTGRFLVAQTLFIALWITLNVIPGVRFDKYPFGFLTLVLSLQAAYAAPLILLAQNRQDDRDRANLVQDRQQAARNLEDTEFLARELADVRLALGEVVTRDFLRTELRELIDELGSPVASDAATKPKRRKSKSRKVPPGDGDVGALTEPQQPDEHDGSVEPPLAPRPEPAYPDSGDRADQPIPPG
jgi:uncharacterized membrane protein